MNISKVTTSIKDILKNGKNQYAQAELPISEDLDTCTTTTTQSKSTMCDLTHGVNDTSHDTSRNILYFLIIWTTWNLMSIYLNRFAPMLHIVLLISATVATQFNNLRRSSNISQTCNNITKVFTAFRHI